MKDDEIKFENSEFKFGSIDIDAFLDMGYGDKVLPFDKQYAIDKEDMVNNPKHYTQGRFEAIEVIEDAISEAPNPLAGFLQAQVLKYMLRMWYKSDAQEDAQKARWYLNKLIDTL